jgi:hypothetical protein
MFENFTQELEVLKLSRDFIGKSTLSTNVELEDYDHIVNRPKASFEGWPIITTRKLKEDKAIWINPNLKIDILDKSFLLNRKLTNIYKAIQNSENLLELNEDWDDEGAIACNPTIYLRAIVFLVKYSNEVLISHNIVIDFPEINLAKDGSIDLEWRNENYILLINFINSRELDIHYYGEDSSSKTIIKGFIDYKSINKDLAFWMQKLD